LQGQQRSWTLDGGATPPLTQDHFRKSSQWTALIRPHAELLANDTAVFPALAGDYPCVAELISDAPLPSRPHQGPAFICCWALELWQALCRLCLQCVRTLPPLKLGV